MTFLGVASSKKTPSIKNNKPGSGNLSSKKRKTSSVEELEDDGEITVQQTPTNQSKNGSQLTWIEMKKDSHAADQIQYFLKQSGAEMAKEFLEKREDTCDGKQRDNDDIKAAAVSKKLAVERMAFEAAPEKVAAADKITTAGNRGGAGFHSQPRPDREPDEESEPGPVPRRRR